MHSHAIYAIKRFFYTARIRPMKIYLETYGCTLNQADSDIIAGMLESAGHEICTDSAAADMVVINSCTVKSSTENKIIHRIEQEQAKPLVVSGCMTVNEQRIRKADSDAVIVKPGALSKILEAVDAAALQQPKDFQAVEYKDDLPRVMTYPILRMPIQEGCTSFCHFCQTKLARPKLRSYHPDRIVDMIRQGVANGAKEIQLTGMDCGTYGLERKTNLVELLTKIREVEGDFKVRVGMLNPVHASKFLPELIDVMDHPKFYQFLHVPVQTGSEKVCREMNRPDKVAEFVDIVEKCRARMPLISIMTDLIVGFPTEDETDHQQTLELVRDLKPNMVNISKFSSRPGTKASEMKQMDSKIIKARSAELTKVYRAMQDEQDAAHVGKVYDVLVLEKAQDYKARTHFYKQVAIKNYQGELGATVKVRIEAAAHGTLVAMVVEQ